MSCFGCYIETKKRYRCDNNEKSSLKTDRDDNK